MLNAVDRKAECSRQKTEAGGREIEIGIEIEIETEGETTVPVNSSQSSQV
jgi:hypothetical protein